jgi:hypothetical protein
LTVKIVPHRKFKLSGATLVEMVAAIIILGLVVIGVAQFLLVSKINVYTDNVRTGVLQALSDTIVKYQTMNVGETNVPVDEDLLPHIPSGTMRLEKSGPVNGVYTIQGSITWRAFPDGNGSFLFHEQLALQVPE